MVTVRLSGVHVVKSRGREYHYAWRGGPRLEGVPGSPDYIRAFAAAHESRKRPVTGTFKQIIIQYRASASYAKLGDHTKRAYAKHLDTIEARFGDLPIKALDEKGVRAHFIAWQDEMTARPRTADMAIGVLKRVLSWAESRVLVGFNHVAPIERLHSANKADDIWTADDIAAIRSPIAKASKEVLWAVDLALHTGLRQSDLIRLAWGHEADGAFVFRTSKRGRVVVIPITRGCRALLGRIEQRGPLILTTERGKRPWTADGLRASFGAVCLRAGVNRTFHDLRRTAATALVAAGLASSQVAAIMGWSEDDVEAMKRKYVSRSAVVQGALAQLNKES